MKAFYDLLPLLVFFVAYTMGGIYWATALAIVAATAQLLLGYLRTRKFERTHLINFGVITLFGGLTLILRDATFIKWKPTIVNWLFAVVFAGSLVVGNKCVLERMLGTQLDLSTVIWRRMTLAWAGFFLLCGSLNLYVAFGIDIDGDDLSTSQKQELEAVVASDAAYARTVLLLDPATLTTSELAALIPTDRHVRMATYFDTIALDYWVKFKVFGLFGLTLCFVVAQSVYLAWLTRGGANGVADVQ